MLKIVRFVETVRGAKFIFFLLFESVLWTNSFDEKISPAKHDKVFKVRAK